MRALIPIDRLSAAYWKPRNLNKDSIWTQAQFHAAMVAVEAGWDLATAQGRIGSIAAEEIRAWWVLQPTSGCQAVRSGAEAAGAAVAELLVAGLRNDPTWLAAVQQRSWRGAYDRFVELGSELVHRNHPSVVRSFFSGMLCA